MTLSIDIAPELEAELRAKAKTEGITLEAYLRRLLERELKSAPSAHGPLRSSYGVLAQYGPAPSAEEIDQNRAEMFRNFARDGEW